MAAHIPTVEEVLQTALAAMGLPPMLMAATQSAVFPAGARLRPHLCLAVAQACGGQPNAAWMQVAAALELLHCASLVHDDLPCFDDALLRRGRPSVHCQFGEAVAVLAGDALIVASIQLIATCALPMAASLVAIVSSKALRLIGGQAQELQPTVDCSSYHQAKTASLFEASTMIGAALAHSDVQRWQPLGLLLGEAYQLADDLLDMQQDKQSLNMAMHLGENQAGVLLSNRLQQIRSHPLMSAHPALRNWIGRLERQMFPQAMSIDKQPNNHAAVV